MWVSMLLLGLFSIALLSFIISFTTENNPNHPVMSNPAFNSTWLNLTRAMSSSDSTVTEMSNKTQGDKGNQPISVFLILNSFLEVPWTLYTVSVGTVKIVWYFVFATLFGNNFNILSGTILAIMSATVLFLIIKNIRTGESER